MDISPSSLNKLKDLMRNKTAGRASLQQLCDAAIEYYVAHAENGLDSNFHPKFPVSAPTKKKGDAAPRFRMSLPERDNLVLFTKSLNPFTRDHTLPGDPPFAVLYDKNGITLRAKGICPNGWSEAELKGKHLSVFPFAVDLRMQAIKKSYEEGTTEIYQFPFQINDNQATCSSKVMKLEDDTILGLHWFELTKVMEPPQNAYHRWTEELHRILALHHKHTHTEEWAKTHQPEHDNEQPKKTRKGMFPHKPDKNP